MHESGVEIMTALPAISASLSSATAIGYDDTAVGDAIMIRSDLIYPNAPCSDFLSIKTGVPLKKNACSDNIKMPGCNIGKDHIH